MKIKYRFLEGKKPDRDYMRAAGMAFIGYDSIENEGYASFINARMERTYSIRNSLEKLTENDIPEYYRNLNLKWGKILEFNILDSTVEEDDWIPDELLIERMKYWDSIRDARERVKREQEEKNREQERKAA